MIAHEILLHLVQNCSVRSVLGTTEDREPLPEAVGISCVL